MSLSLPSYYLAPISYYARLAQSEGEVHVCPDETYQKQTFRSRCEIDSPNGRLTLTVPVVKSETPKPLMRDVRISDHGNWRHLHWNALVSSYHRTPFFEFYADEFAPFYERRYEFLFDFNQALQALVCELLDVKQIPQAGTDRRPSIAEEGFNVRPYYQIFSVRHGFLPDLSIVDLLFNMGPESILYLLPPK